MFMLSLAVLVSAHLFGLPAASVSAAPSSAPPPTDASTPDACSSADAITLGSTALRVAVQAAARDAVYDRGRDALDASAGAVWMEHVNLVVGDMSIATKFYVDFLGMTAEREANPRANHFNLGLQQLHLAAATDDNPTQRVTGSVGLTVPSLRRIRERVGVAKKELENTLFSVRDDEPDEGSKMTVVCPWGNKFHLYDISIDDGGRYDFEASQSAPKMESMHGGGGAYGYHRMAVRGHPGIRYVEIACREGTASAIAEFYEKILGCHVFRTRVAPDMHSTKPRRPIEMAAVTVGPGVHIVFVESVRLSDDILERMRGVHICLYIPNFRQAHDTLKERKLIWTNPLFTSTESCDTWEEVHASRAFRFKDIIDTETGKKVLELEHEIRSMLHGQYMKVPPYVPN
ncbi:hypothetical protein ACHAWF_001782 [Thalassiosira exigua]